MFAEMNFSKIWSSIYNSFNEDAP